ncbi:MAG: hypothetical protein RLZZ347_134 [Candidatus Parcubacteria bacterium]|jgi:hypothetical protein
MDSTNRLLTQICHTNERFFMKTIMRATTLCFGFIGGALIANGCCAFAVIPIIVGLMGVYTLTNK